MRIVQQTDSLLVAAQSRTANLVIGTIVAMGSYDVAVGQAIASFLGVPFDQEQPIQASIQIGPDIRL